MVKGKGGSEMSKLTFSGALKSTVVLSCVIASGIGAASKADDTLYIRGKIYTGASPAFAEALAVRDARIVAVGTTADIQKQRHNGDRVVDLHGAVVIPGIIDSHAHTLFGSMALHGLNLSTPEKSIPAEQPQEVIIALRRYAADHPRDKVIFGRADYDQNRPPRHEILDRAVSDRPVIIHHVGEHSIWVNARALALAGITDKPMADPLEESGIVRSNDGKPVGMVREASMELVERAAIALLSQDEKLDIVRQGLRYLNQFGITTVVNATGDLAEIELYGTLRDRKKLTVRTRTAFGAVAYPHRLTPQFLQDIETARARFNDDWVSANLIKFFLDGGSNPWLPVYNSQAEFKALVSELDRRGFNIMTHAWLAESTTTALDTYEQIEAETAKRDHRFRIEHADKIEPEDLPRFARLSIVASMQPSFCCSPVPADAKPLDEPWRSLLDSGARLAFNSDWPCTWPPDPFVGMQELVTRAVWTGKNGYGANQAGRVTTGEINSPAERLNVMQAVDGYTKGGAYAAFMENKIGTLEVGKLADFAVLSQDIFSVPATDLAKTRVKTTVVGGQMVYGGVP